MINRRLILVSFFLLCLEPQRAFASRSEDRDAAVTTAWAKLDSVPTCCIHLAEEDFPEIVADAFKSRHIPTDRARFFAPGKSYFYGFRLPDASAPYFLQVGSGAKQAARFGGYPSSYFFEPSVLLLDREFKEVRRLENFSCKPRGWLQEEEMGYYGLIKIDPGVERYLVVFANPDGRGKRVNLKADGSTIVPGLTFDWAIPFGPDGLAEVRIAKEKGVNLFRKKANSHCRVVE
jgi:hypothetical protein